MLKIIAMIPARMASTRYAGKPLIDICGLTMIEHVWQRVRLNKKVDAVYIATCDDEIRETAEKFAAEVIMTADSHERCTDRIAEAASILDRNGVDFDILLNIQGDEPLIHPESLDLLIGPFLKDDTIQCVNLIEELNNEADVNDLNNVKAIFDLNYNALYFSRLPIPNGTQAKHYKQLGIYGLTRKMVLQYARMEQTPLEIAESDDMLRFVENGIPVKVVLTPYETIGVDTPEDHQRVNRIMDQDEVFEYYRPQ